MDTHNVISTPNITGNIGSCSTSMISMRQSSDVWGSIKKDYATNSCTGVVTEGPLYWDGSFAPYGIGLFILGLAFIAVIFASL